MNVGTIASIHGKVSFYDTTEEKFCETLRENIVGWKKIPFVEGVEVKIEGSGFRVYTEVGFALAKTLKVGQEVKLHIDWGE